MVAFSSNWFILFPLAYCLFVALRLAEGSVDQQPRATGSLVARGLIGLMFVFALLAVGFRASLLGILWIVLLALFACVVFWKSRRLDRSAMLLIALHATDTPQQRIVADAWQTTYRGWLPGRAAGLARDLRDGVPWFAALERRNFASGVYQTLAVRLSGRYGSRHQLSRRDTHQDLVELSPLAIETEAERLLGRLVIFTWVVWLLPIFVLFLTFIMPTFLEMFEEFGMELPLSMKLLASLLDYSEFTGTKLLLALFQLLVMGLGVSMLLIWLFPQILRTPGLQWLGRDYYRNLGFVALYHALQREPDLVSACRATAELVPMSSISRKYAQTAKYLWDGQSPRDAFLASRLLTAREYRVFGIGFDQADAGWCLQQLASWKMARMLNRYSLVVQLGVILFTLLTALVVGALAVGVIQSLSAMITELS